MVILLNRKRLEAPLPYRAAGVVVTMGAADMRRQQPVHPAAEVTISRWPECPVDVIRHQAGSQHAQGHALTGLAEQMQEGLLIARAMKDLGLCVSAIKDVVARASC